MSEQMPENYSRLYVQIAYPLPHSRWPLNSFIPVQVQAQGTEEIKQVELFINDVPLEAQDAGADSFSGAWMWQPGVSGEFVLIAKAVTESGAVSLSVPVRITAIEAGFTISPFNVQGGETLESIAQDQGIVLEAIQVSNPKIDPLLPLQPHELVFIPNLPAPVVNLKIIPSLPFPIFPQEEGAAPAPGDAPLPEEPSRPKTNLWDDFTFMLQLNNPSEKQAGTGPKYIPNAPALTGDFKGCDVHLGIGGWWYDPIDPLAVKMQEDGFFVYRSRNGSPAERIHTVPPVHDFKDDGNSQFYDPGQYGTLVYYVSAFNVLGEAASNPVTIALDPGLCPAPARGGLNEIRMENGDLILPFQMDTAYLYLQINGSQAVRIPEGERTFLPGSGLRFDLYDYLDTLIDELQAPDLELHMEVWGWQAGTLKYAGDFDTSVHRALLTICSVEGTGSCTNGNGSWVGSLNLPQDKQLNDLKYEVRWQVTGLTTAESMYFQISAAPFSGDAYNATSNLLYARKMSAKETEAVFELSLGQILYPDPPNSELGWGPPGYPSHIFDFTSNGFLGQPAGTPFTLYLRVQPGLVMSGYNQTSNIVPLMYNTSLPPSNMPPLASEYSSLYEVEILEDSYKPPDFYLPEMWGCVVIDEDPTGQYAPGQVVCPGKMPAQDDCGDKSESECLLLGLGSAMGFVYDQFALGYELYKEEIIKGVRDLIPGCDGSSHCREAVHKGVDYGAAYLTGLPADMPKSEELIADSVAKAIVDSATEMEKYYTGEEESVIGLFCEHVVDCEEEISDYIEVELKKAKSIASQPACTHGYEAYFHGQQPVCLDPSIVVHAAPGSGDFPAVALVRVTRESTPESLAAQIADQDKYRLFVRVDGEKFDQASQTRLTGPLYAQAQLSIPWLEPGESIVLPATLGLLGKGAYETRRLYFDGVSHMRAVESCYSSDSSWDWVPCQGGGLDSWDFANPPSMLDWVEVEP